MVTHRVEDHDFFIERNLILYLNKQMPELYEFNKILIKIKKRKTESLNKCEWDTWHF